MRTLLTYCIVIAALYFSGGTVYAADMRLTIASQEGGVGDVVEVAITLDTANISINAIEGAVQFPTELLRFEDIDDSDSALNFWVEKPTYVPGQGVRFSGITPGGLLGTDISVLKLLFVSVAPGTGDIEITDAQALVNDGLGTNAPLTTQTATVVVSDTVLPHTEGMVDLDDEAPEAFTPELAQDPDVFDGAWFLVFATEDKGSGIDQYEVREGFFGFFRKAESPYKLTYQARNRTIYVKATDRMGNKRTAVVYPLDSTFEERTKRISIGILVVCVLFVFATWVLRRRSVR